MISDWGCGEGWDREIGGNGRIDRIGSNVAEVTLFAHDSHQGERGLAGEVRNCVARQRQTLGLLRKQKKAN